MFIRQSGGAFFENLQSIAEGYRGLQRDGVLGGCAVAAASPGVPGVMDHALGQALASSTSCTGDHWGA